MKIRHVLTLLCFSSGMPVMAQFNIGIRAASTDPLKGSLDALPVLRSGFALSVTKITVAYKSIIQASEKGHSEKGIK